MFLLGSNLRIFPDEFHSMGTTIMPSYGVSQGRGMAPSDVYFFIVERRRGNQGVRPIGVTFAMTSETCRGLSVGVGTLSVWSLQGRVRSAI
jgi:hypothetical protein